MLELREEARASCVAAQTIVLRGSAQIGAGGNRCVTICFCSRAWHGLAAEGERGHVDVFPLCCSCSVLIGTSCMHMLMTLDQASSGSCGSCDW